MEQFTTCIAVMVQKQTGGCLWMWMGVVIWLNSAIAGQAQRDWIRLDE